MVPRLWGLCALALMMIAASAAHAELKCANVLDIGLPHAEVTHIATEHVGRGTACRIDVTSKPAKGSDIRIQVWVPVGDAWNGKYVQVGNGGLAGQIPTQAIAAFAAQGYAAAGTDDGHQTKQNTDAAWALHHPEKVVDFGWRALKETTDIARALILALKGEGPNRAYFAGCSDGGREALMEAQRFPLDFDGVLAGAPAADIPRLMGLAISNAKALRAPGADLPPSKLAVLQAAALRVCGDGQGFIRDPKGCRFDPAMATCRPGQDPAGCLTAAQATAARSIYTGLRDRRVGRVIYPGYSPGAEAEPGGWALWTTGDGQQAPLMLQLAAGYFRDFVVDNPKYDVLGLDLGGDLDRARAKTGAALNATNPTLTAFRAHGGKLIQYHGWNDPAIPPAASVDYYEDVRRTMGDPSAFYRMYMVPGMLHCGGGAGPSEVDWLGLLDKWVTRGAAPAAVVAGSGAPGRPAGHTQLLCPYPAVARRTGTDANDASSYRCR